MEKNIIGSAFEYSKEGLLGNITKWVLLIVLAIVQAVTLCIVPLLNGYMVRIYSGEDTLPDIDNWGKLFFDGWKYNIIALLYMIPAIIVAVVLAFFTLLSLSEVMAIVSGGGVGIIGLISGVITALLIMLVIIVIISLFLIMALVRFGKTGKIGEAFNFSALNQQISKGVGWLGYFGYIIVLWILGLILWVIIAAINIILLPIGILITILILPAWAVFSAKYITNVYDAGN